MEIVFLNSVDSTHKFLKDHIETKGYTHPLSVVTQCQTNGIGSRDNKWEGKEGNLFFSFVLKRLELPTDLPLQSASIYFSFILKEILSQYGSKIWVKWPNDFYIDNKKIGGTITNLTKELIYCGIGINLNKVSNQYGYLDIDIEIKKLIKEYFEVISNKIAWKDIFSKYSIEFEKSKELKTTINNQNGIVNNNNSLEKISLKEAVINSDGSIQINNKKVFSLR
ncbi:MAG: biotin--[acetyl-CoA-carboxylase] ligase [Campylobacterota bacterium]|nr:biotin--[acetyl-CoA-carboxylase] ligase [Campylobacterota bacterium]